MTQRPSEDTSSGDGRARARLRLASAIVAMTLLRCSSPSSEPVAFEDKRLAELVGDEITRACQGARARTEVCDGLAAQELGPEDCAVGLEALRDSCEAIVSELESCRAEDLCAWGTADVCEPIRECGLIGTGVAASWDYVVMIASTTTAMESCEYAQAAGKPAPGPDIFNIRLRDAECGDIAFARTVASGFDDVANEYSNAQILDGTALDSAACEEGFVAGELHSMGCQNAYLIVEFLDRNSALVSLTAGMRVHIEEHGAQCTNGSDTDFFDVFLCTDPSAVREDGDRSSCTLKIGGGSGDVWAAIPLAGGTEPRVGAPTCASGGCDPACEASEVCENGVCVAAPIECVFPPVSEVGACHNDADCEIVERAYREAVSGMELSGMLPIAGECVRCCEGDLTEPECSASGVVFTPGASCAVDCIRAETGGGDPAKGLSIPCATCHADYLGCAVGTCHTGCLAEQDLETCGTCVLDNCFAPFVACIGNVAHDLCPDFLECAGW